MLDALIRNARIITLDSRRARATSLGLWNGLIVGLDDEVDDLPTRAVIDAAGATLLPGFHDAHCHTTSFGLQRVLLDLAAVRGRDATLTAVAEYAADLPAHAWVIGMGYGGGMPLTGHLTRDELDQAGGGRPVWLTHYSGHQCVVSSAVLALIGHSDSAPELERGRIVADARGRPTGLLEESAMDLVKQHAGHSSAEELARAIDAATLAYAAEGITSFSEAGVGCPGMDHSQVEIAAYQLARSSRRLHARAQLMVHNELLRELPAHPADAIARGLDLGIRTGFGDTWLSLGAMKIWVDGLGIEGDGSESEDFDNDPAVLRRDIVAAHRAGWQVAAHAMGARAIDLVLDALAEAAALGPVPTAGPAGSDFRHRIEHGAFIRADQIPRLAEMRMTVATQPVFLTEFGDMFGDLLGPERTADAIRIRSLLDAGIHVAGSSDRPVAPGAPLRGVEAMVRRQSASGREYSPAERVDVLTALAAYTSGGARAARSEHLFGRLAPRLAADLVFVADDPTQVSAAQIGSIAVLATVVGGMPTYDPASLLADLARPADRCDG
jgi:predicted amidohydrolase YtcJ